MKKFVKKISVPVIAYILGAITFGGIGVAIATDIQSRTVLYETEANENITTVEGALNDLYEKANNVGSCMVSFKTGDNFAEAIKSLYTEDGEQNLYYHDGTGSYGSYEAGDGSYRYAGPSASVENYVCYGSDEDTCPSDNLYRIIGIFKEANDKYQVKLIKASAPTSAMLGTNGAYRSGTTYYWNNSNSSSSKSNWNESNLNTVNLNGNYIGYLNNINAKWVNYIDNHTWKVGGNTDTLIRQTAGAKNVYTREITSPAASTTYSAAIGLMYVSDYMYGASATFWGTLMGYNSDSTKDYRAAKTSNWLALGTSEWTIARLSDSSYEAFSVGSDGYVGNNNVYRNYCVARPVFYLKSSVYYNGGTGTSSDPYRISV